MRARALIGIFALVTCAVGAIAACVGDSPAVPSDAGTEGSTTDGGGDTSCGNTATDPKNCGACGKVCAAGFGCTQGVCDSQVVKLVAGGNHNCVTMKNGAVYCWGANAFGQSGADASATAPPTSIPRDRQSNTFSARDFAAGALHSCGLRPDNTVSCWGNGVFGQLGAGFTAPDAASPVPGFTVKTNFTTELGLTSIGHGPEANHTCGVNDAGAVISWGLDNINQVTLLDAGAPSTCFNGDSCRGATRALNELAVQVAVGGATSCSLAANGTIRCWGGGRTGELGNSLHGTACGFQCGGKVFVVPAPPSTFIAAGQSTLCAIVASDGSVQCWGNNETGMIGHLPAAPDGGSVDPCCSIDCTFSQGKPRCVDHPVAVPGILGAKMLAVGDVTVCALKIDGTVWCWGGNDKGQLGRGTNDPAPSPVPTQITTLSSVAEISAGANHFCALKTDGTVWCWGLNDKGQLGAGTANSNAPVEVTTLPR